MNRINTRRHSIMKSLVLVTICLLLSAGSLAVGSVAENRRAKSADEEEKDKYLFVWTGDQARQQPDFLAVIDFNENSRDYGKVITTVPLPGAGSTGNEPHHVGLSRDGRVLACGGLLSVLKG